MKAAIVLFGFFAFSSVGFCAETASFIDGTWVGQGIFQLGPKVYNCPQSTQKFVGNEKIYEVREADVQCEQGFKQNFDVISTFEIRENGELYFKGKKAGQISAQSLRTQYEENGVVNTIEISIQGDYMFYRDVMGIPGKTPIFGFVGVFQKQK